MSNFNPLLDIKEEVKQALLHHQAVVALESTIISHGMPYPQNVEMAKKTEQIIRNQGAVPATIAIMDGKIKIGLTEADLERLARAKEVIKVSRRDLASVIAFNKVGATTVASTMIAAAMAGIKFFVTGGIGGVHRGYEETMDVSADLEELAHTDVTVICAGAKAILDLPRTMEYLETKGVGVIGYQTKVLPAFYTRDSHLSVPLTAETPAEIAKVVATKTTLGLKGGLLVVNPLPKADSLDSSYINQIIDAAVEESKQQGILGKEVTPFLLKRIVEKTEGKSLAANLVLVYNNAKLGAQIACAYFQTQK
ncbi:MAG TPA: pseudouridine-5'-phosphate glycosidase [Bacilli bacterium]|nr:MAG: Pseudouridine-5'-phosphate glycosidase [Tenericutes bacterium ADurb.BinA124]HNZ50469.1 pseudouridine-5'-phosphate glycosidase [Bacilli bacterium]HPX83750.1 pseudouridine-5'-phosphate glycosidase [Bacilli bacterium]HQC73947.1 pseudouridine-5'-phosphate glycosidase [Bacilli bacterium]